MTERITITGLVHEAMAAAPRPLEMSAIVDYLTSHHPRPPQNPEKSARNAIAQSALLVPLYDGSYAYLPNYVSGGAFRFTLIPPALERMELYLDELSRLALWPRWYAPGEQRNQGPLQVSLADGPDVIFTPGYGGLANEVAQAPREFWNWLGAYYPEPGDDLVLRISADDPLRYTLEFAPQDGRDEERLAVRNRALADRACEFMQRRRATLPAYELITAMIVLGVYRHPDPPDNLHRVLVQDERFVSLSFDQYRLTEHMSAEHWRMAEAHHDMVNSVLERLGSDPGHAAEVLSSLSSDDPGEVAEALLESGLAELLGLPGEMNEMLGLPPDMQGLPSFLLDDEPDYEEPPFRLERKGDRARWRKDVYTFKVRLKWARRVWRNIEIRGDQTLHELHWAILDAYDWDEEHLYSYFLSNRLWDSDTQISSPHSQQGWDAEKVRIGALDLKVKDRFLFLFDYGDSHEFELSLLIITPAQKGVKYPRVVKETGVAPPQYSDWDENEDEDD
ncbi:MAG: plasmid pRiA4b ORF-3 family protein [Chloroflexi bacterium]|nr:plasmid pRiA4b ORF-3 family protein [Chloroflexota bacterium]